MRNLLNFFMVLLFVLLPTTTFAVDYATQLQNKRLIMKGANHAGFAFKGKDTLIAYAELTREAEVLEARVQWISEDMFLVTEKERVDKQCPPRNWVYKVIKISDKSAIIKAFWTGWDPLKDFTEEYLFVP